MTSAAKATPSRRLIARLGAENVGLLLALLAVVIAVRLALAAIPVERDFRSVAFQLPELGLLTLAMLMPIIVWRHQPRRHLHRQYLRADAGLGASGQWRARRRRPAPSCSDPCWRSAWAPATGLVMGPVIAYTGAHPILVSLSMMIFLRGLGEFLTRGADISGLPRIRAAAGSREPPRRAHSASDPSGRGASCGTC